MTVGIVSYLSERGLGNMCHDLRRQLGIDRQLVIPDGDWPMRLDWCNGEEFYLREWTIQRDDLVAWKQTDKIDTLVSIETGFGDNTFRWAKELGMRTVLIAMWENYSPKHPAYQNVDLFICPSWKCFQEIQSDNKIFLPYPVDTTEFKFQERTGPAKKFIHNAGSGGLGGRKGTLEAIMGFIEANVDARLVIRAQQSDFLDKIGKMLKMDPLLDDPRIMLVHSQIPERADLYKDGDVLIYVSHYDGHSLVALEGMSCGMPVITTDAEPMNEYWSGLSPLCVKVAERKPAGTVNPHCMANWVDIKDLAAKIRFCAREPMSAISHSNRLLVEKSHSWDVLRDRWKKALGLA